MGHKLQTPWAHSGYCRNYVQLVRSGYLVYLVMCAVWAVWLSGCLIGEGAELVEYDWNRLGTILGVY